MSEHSVPRPVVEALSQELPPELANLADLIGHMVGDLTGRTRREVTARQAAFERESGEREAKLRERVTVLEQQVAELKRRDAA